MKDVFGGRIRKKQATMVAEDEQTHALFLNARSRISSLAVCVAGCMDHFNMEGLARKTSVMEVREIYHLCTGVWWWWW